jgi:hypothetical protein
MFGLHPGRLRRRAEALLTIPLTVVLVLALAAPAHSATEVFTATVRDLGVQGFGGSFDGCVSTSTTVLADKHTVRYFFPSVDQCTGELVNVAGEAAPTVFDVGGNFATAHVVASVVLGDGRVVQVDNTWTALGKPARDRFTFTLNLPGELHLKTKAHGTTVETTVSGVAPLEVGTIA